MLTAIYAIGLSCFGRRHTNMTSQLTVISSEQGDDGHKNTRHVSSCPAFSCLAS